MNRPGARERQPYCSGTDQARNWKGSDIPGKQLGRTPQQVVMLGGQKDKIPHTIRWGRLTLAVGDLLVLPFSPVELYATDGSGPETVPAQWLPGLDSRHIARAERTDGNHSLHRTLMIRWMHERNY